MGCNTIHHVATICVSMHNLFVFAHFCYYEHFSAFRLKKSVSAIEWQFTSYSYLNNFVTSALRLKKYVFAICHISKHSMITEQFQWPSPVYYFSNSCLDCDNSWVNFDMPTLARGSRPQAPASPDGPPPGVRSVHPHMREAPIVE